MNWGKDGAVLMGHFPEIIVTISKPNWLGITRWSVAGLRRCDWIKAGGEGGGAEEEKVKRKKGKSPLRGL